MYCVLVLFSVLFVTGSNCNYSIVLMIIYSDDELISSTPKISILPSRLDISNVDASDDAVYRCEAVNKVGSKTKAATLTVESKKSYFYPKECVFNLWIFTTRLIKEKLLRIKNVVMRHPK